MENKINDIYSKFGLTYYHGQYNSKPFILTYDASVDYLDLQEGEFDEQEMENLFNWMSNKL